MVLQQVAPSQFNKITHPQPPRVSLVDMCPFLRRHLHIALNQLAEQYGNIFQIRVGFRNFVVLNGFETLKEALVKQQDIFNAKADFDIFQLKPQSEFMELKSGDCWKKHHDIVVKVMHTFLAGKSEVYESWITEEAEKLANIFLGYKNQSFLPDLHISAANLSFIQRLVFSKRGSADDEDLVKTASYLRTIPNGLLNGIILDVLPKIWQPIFGFLHQDSLKAFVRSLAVIDSYVVDNIEQHRESFRPENLRDITDGLLKASNEVTDSERNNFRLSESDIVKGTLFQFVAAGTQLPSYVLSWALLYMIAYPDIQAQVQEELDEVVGKEQEISFRERSRLPFTEACINEIFRHSSSTTFPPINYATTTDTTLEGYFIPKNTPLIVNYYGLTRDQRYWKKPEQFNPYRFLDGNGKLRKDLLDKFYPFGVGSRRCIGEYLGRLQIFLLFANLLLRCKFEKEAGEELSFEANLPGPFIFPKQYKVIVKPRF
ncbi:MAG: cytochrome P450 [Leptolyngbya sp. SIO1D8]|nr:cytochrome P450 [Leptolyngbya sp. SIO1D8]